MRRRLLFLLLAAIAIALVATYLFYQRKEPTDVLVLFGNVDVRQVDLGFRVSGKVNHMPFQEGDLVRAGALMGRLDRQPYADQVDQAKYALESIKLSYQHSQELLQRREELLSNGGVSQEDYENALSTRDVYVATVGQQEAALAVAKKNLSFTELYAPSDGTILTRIREPGTVVREADPIYTLSLISPVWIRAFVPEPSLGKIYPGMPAEVYTDTKGGKVYKGHIGFISPVAEFTPKNVETTQLRTDLVYRLRIIADNPDEFLRQGMPVTVKLPLKQGRENP